MALRKNLELLLGRIVYGDGYADLGKQVSFTDDYIFYSVMEDPDNCREFLERVLNIKVAELKYVTGQKSIRNRKLARGIRLDVYVRDMDGNSYDIEMQTTTEKNIAKRIRYYHSEMDGYQIRKGESYDKLKKNIVIFVCTYDPFDDNKSVYTFKKTCVENTNLALEDETISIILNSEGSREGITNELSNVLDYIKTGESKDDYTMRLLEKVRQLNDDWDWRDRQMTLRMKLKEQYEAGRDFAKTEANITAVVKMLKLGIPEDTVQTEYPNEFEEGKKRYREQNK